MIAIKCPSVSLSLAATLVAVCCTAPVDAAPPLQIKDAQSVLIDNVVISAPIAGTVESVLVVEGDGVHASEPVVRLDAQRAQAEWKAAIAAQHAASIAARNDVNSRYAQRTQQVHQRELQQSQLANRQFAGSVTETEMERLQLVVDQAELSMEQSQLDQETAIATAEEKAALSELAELRLQEHQITSPIHGRVAERMVQTGQWVQSGGPLMRIISINPIRISGFVDGSQIDGSLRGALATFSWTDSRSNPPIERQLSGKVTFVSNELNPITGDVRVWAELANPDEILLPGTKGSLTIERPAD